MGRDRLLIGFALIAFGYAVLGNYVALPGYIRFLARGGTSAAGNALDMDVVLGAARTILWMYAFALGAMGLYLHSLLARHRHYVGWGLGICVTWLVFWSIPALPRMSSAYYLTVGSAILGLIVFANLAAGRSGRIPALYRGAVFRPRHLGRLRARQHRPDPAPGRGGARSLANAAQHPDHQADDRTAHCLGLSGVFPPP